MNPIALHLLGIAENTAPPSWPKPDSWGDALTMARAVHILRNTCPGMEVKTSSFPGLHVSRQVVNKALNRMVIERFAIRLGPNLWQTRRHEEWQAIDACLSEAIKTESHTWKNHPSVMIEMNRMGYLK